MQNKMRILLAKWINIRFAGTVLALGLNACGGSGGVATNDRLPSSSERALASTTSISSAVTIDPAIPNATRSMIKQVISPFGSAAPGASLNIPSASAGGDTIIMALDAEDSILLAALTNSASTTLTVASTADALARLAFGPLSQSLTPATFRRAVQETTAYPQLIAAIQAEVNVGKPASQSAVVHDRLGVVLNQAIPALSTAMGVATASGKPVADIAPTPIGKNSISSLLSPVTEVKAPFPFRVIPSGGYSVYIRGGRVELVNTMQITWAAFSDQAPGTEIPLNGASVASSFAGSVAPLLGTGVVGAVASAFGPDPITVPGNKGLGFFLTVKQTEESRTENILVSVQDVASTLLELSIAGALISESCTSAVVSAIISPDQARAFSKDASVDTFLNYFKELTLSKTAIRSVVEQCYIDPSTRQQAAENAGLFARSLAKYLSLYSAFGAANNLATLSFRLTQMAFYWDKSYTLKVCEQAGTGEVVSCVAKMTFEPANIAMIEGATFRPLLRGLAADGHATPVPSGLLYEPQSLDGPVFFLGKDNPAVFARQLGTGSIRVTDPFTKTVSEPYSVDVVTPSFDPDPLTVQVGSSGNMQLKGPAGKTLITKNDGAAGFSGGALLAGPTLTPSSLASTEATIANLLFNSIFTVRGVAPGSATLAVKNTYTGKAITGNVNINPVPLVERPSTNSDLTLDFTGRVFNCTTKPGFQINPLPNGIHYQITQCLSELNVSIKCPSVSCPYTDLTYVINYDYVYGPSANPDSGAAICGKTFGLTSTRRQLTVPFDGIYVVSQLIDGCQSVSVNVNVAGTLKDAKGNVVAGSNSFTLAAPPF